MDTLGCERHRGSAGSWWLVQLDGDVLLERDLAGHVRADIVVLTADLQRLHLGTYRVVGPVRSSSFLDWFSYAVSFGLCFNF